MQLMNFYFLFEPSVAAFSGVAWRNYIAMNHLSISQSKCGSLIITLMACSAAVS